MFRQIFPALALALMVTAAPAQAQQHVPKHVNTTASLAPMVEKAKAGDSDAQYVVAMRYERGQDVTQSFTEANTWFKLAAAQGNSMAEFKLGDHSQFGKGVPVNLAEAAKWYQRAAEHDNYAAQHALGRLYLSGDGVKQDFVEGYFWLSLASLDKQYAADSTRSENLLKPAQIAAVKARIDKWRKEKAKDKKKG